MILERVLLGWTTKNPINNLSQFISRLTIDKDTLYALLSSFLNTKHLNYVFLYISCVLLCLFYAFGLKRDIIEYHFLFITIPLHFKNIFLISHQLFSDPHTQLSPLITLTLLPIPIFIGEHHTNFLLYWLLDKPRIFYLLFIFVTNEGGWWSNNTSQTWYWYTRR